MRPFALKKKKEYLSRKREDRRQATDCEKTFAKGMHFIIKR